MEHAVRANSIYNASDLITYYLTNVGWNSAFSSNYDYGMSSSEYSSARESIEQLYTSAVFEYSKSLHHRGAI